MKKIICALIFISIASCKSGTKADNIPSTQKEDWKTLFKKRVITTCLRESGINLERDNSGAIQYEVLGANPKLIKETDSLGRMYAERILNTPSYFEGKPIINMALALYTSNELEAIANESYKKNLK